MSCGESVHIWGVVDTPGGAGGVLARLGAEGEWEPGVGGGWRHVSTRAWVQ